MNKKVLIGILAVIIAIAVAVVCIVALGDKDTDSKKDNDKKTEAGENHVVLDPSEKNARSKTCLANQRNIVSQLFMCALSDGVPYSGTITYTSDGEDYSDFHSTVEGLDEAKFRTLFQYVPICPACGSFKITITPAVESEYPNEVEIVVECIDNLDDMPHASE